MTCWCSVRGRGRTALTAVAALAACVSLTSSVDAGVVGYYSDSSTSSSGNVSLGLVGAFSFTTGTADSLTRFRVKTNGAATTTDATIKLYQHTGALNGSFNNATATVLATWQFNDSLSGGTSTWNTFDLTDVTKLVSGSAAVSSGKQYVLTFGTSVSTALADRTGTRYGTDGWATFGGGGGGVSGSYGLNGGVSWLNRAFQWEVTFGATAVPGAGVAGLSVVGLAGLRRRRR
jgi:hypothetical protein